MATTMSQISDVIVWKTKNNHATYVACSLLDVICHEKGWIFQIWGSDDNMSLKSVQANQGKETSCISYNVVNMEKSQNT